MAAITFLLMAMEDTKQKRMNFFLTYGASQIFIFFFTLYMAYTEGYRRKDEIIAQPCLDM